MNELTLAQRGQIKRIMDRIEVSETGIAVFKDADGLSAVFDSTVQTDYWIRKGRPELVGRYHKGYNPATIRRELSDAYIA